MEEPRKGSGGVCGKERRNQYRSDNPDQGALVGLEVLGQGGIKGGMEWNNVNLG